MLQRHGGIIGKNPGVKRGDLMPMPTFKKVRGVPVKKKTLWNLANAFQNKQVSNSP